MLIRPGLRPDPATPPYAHNVYYVKSHISAGKSPPTTRYPRSDHLPPARDARLRVPVENPRKTTEMTRTKTWARWLWPHSRSPWRRWRSLSPTDAADRMAGSRAWVDTRRHAGSPSPSLGVTGQGSSACASPWARFRLPTWLFSCPSLEDRLRAEREAKERAARSSALTKKRKSRASTKAHLQETCNFWIQAYSKESTNYNKVMRDSACQKAREF